MSSSKIEWRETLRVYRRLLGYLKPYWGTGVWSMICMVVDSACLGLFAYMIKPMIDRLFVDKDPQAIFWLPLIIMGLAVVRCYVSYQGDYGMGKLARHVVQDLRIQVFSAYLRLPVRFFGGETSGQQISRITYTSDQVARAATTAVKSVITDGLLVFWLVADMLWASPYLTLGLLVMVPVIVALMTMISRRYRRISRQVQDTMGDVAGTVREVVDGHREVRIYGGGQAEQRRFDRIADQTGRFNLKIAKTAALSSAAVQTTAALALASIIFLATRPQILATMTSGTFALVMVAMSGLLTPLKRLTNVQGDIQRGVAAAEDMFAIVDYPAERDEGREVIGRSRGEIRLEAVSMSYPEAHVPALRGVDLVCAPGTVTALVGRSGSGKSTLVSLLPRFHDVDQGRILVDGREIDRYTLASLRRQIAWVGQSVVLFEGTVAQNIAYGELAGASEADIVAAAEAANAMEFIAKLPLGIHSPIGESGNMLSGGQRQRIAIARAILKNAPILVLDEATSALDTESERLIQDALQRLMKDRTTLVIAHRLSTVEGADQIAVMDQGRIVERGTHAELLAVRGHYAALHRMQFHGHGGD